MDIPLDELKQMNIELVLIIVILNNLNMLDYNMGKIE